MSFPWDLDWENDFLANRHALDCPAVFDTTGTSDCTCGEPDGPAHAASTADRLDLIAPTDESEEAS